MSKKDNVFSSFDDLSQAFGSADPVEKEPVKEKPVEKPVKENRKIEKKQAKTGAKKTKVQKPKIIRFNHNKFTELREEAYQSFRKKNYQDTLIKYNEAVEMVETFVKACYRQAEQRKKNNDVDGALREHRESKKVFRKVIPVLFRRASIKLQLKDFPGALDDFDLVIKYNPKHVLAYVKRIKIKEKLGDFNSILEDLSVLINIDEEVSVHYYKRASIHLIKGNIESAFNDLKEGYKKDKNNPGIMLKEAKKLADKGKQINALKILDTAVSRLESFYRKFSRKAGFNDLSLFQQKTELPFSKLYIERANIREKLGQYAASEKDFSKVIEIDNDNATAYYRRGEIRQLKRNCKGAIEDFIKTLTIDADNIHAMQHLARLYYETKEYDKAIEQYTVLLNKEPYNIPFFQKRAEIFYIIEKYDKALADIEKVIGFKDKNPSLYLKRGQIKLKLNDKTGFRDFALSFNFDNSSAAGLLKQAEKLSIGKDCEKVLGILNEAYRKAVKSFKVAANYSSDEQLIQGFPERKKTLKDYNFFNSIGIDITRILILRAQAFAGIFKYADAVHDLSEALEYEPANIEFLKLRSLIIYESGKIKDALKDIRKAISIDDRRDDLHFIAAKIYSLADDYDGALKEFNKAIKINPGAAEYHTEAGAFLERRELWEAAIYEFKRALEKDAKQDRAYSGLAKIQISAESFKDIVAAENNARKACSLVENVYNLQTLAAVYSEKEDFIKACELQEKVVDISEKEDKSSALNIKQMYEQNRKFSQIKS